ncbi:MAG: site-2 protease family protein [Puniceicoccaceae bacterium]|nr:MAG: site-2 protease family protein [Puniceicoccaceae bacterium]
MDADRLAQGLVVYLILLICLSVHEWAHAWTADKLGDPTARNLGRVTLNPIPHIDLIGTVLLPLFMILFSPGFFLIGWGKPVPVDRRNLRNGAKGDIQVAMAGPVSNLLLCLVGCIIGGLFARVVPGALELVMMFLYINLLLACFNMIPIPPLDGSYLLKHAVKMSDATYARLAQFGFLIIILLLNFTPLFQILLMAMSAIGWPYFAVLEFLAGQ